MFYILGTFYYVYFAITSKIGPVLVCVFYILVPSIFTFLVSFLTGTTLLNLHVNKWGTELHRTKTSFFIQIINLVLFQKQLRSCTQGQLVDECSGTSLIKKFISKTKIVFNLLHKTSNVTSNSSCWHHWVWAVERLFWEKWRLVFRYLITSASGRKCCLHVLTPKLYVSTFL